MKIMREPRHSRILPTAAFCLSGFLACALSPSAAFGQVVCRSGTFTGAGSATDPYTTACGDLSSATGDASTVYGYASTALGEGTTASGANSFAVGIGATAIGANSIADAQQAIALGSASLANVYQSIAVGAGSAASATASIALGTGARSTAINAVAIGANAQAVRANTVSFGSAGNERQLVNVADGVQDTDATNMHQLNTLSNEVTQLDARTVQYTSGSAPRVDFTGTNGAVLNNVAPGSLVAGSMQAVNGGQLNDSLGSIAQVFGGATAVTQSGGLSAPSFNVSGRSYNTVYDAFTALAAQASASNGTNDPSTLNPVVIGQGAAVSTSGTVLGVGASGTIASAVLGDGAHAGNSATALGSGSAASGNGSVAVGANAQASADSSVALGAGSVATDRNVVSVGGNGVQRRITNVSAGVSASDAATVGQVDDSTHQAIATAQSYADQADQRTLSAATAYTDRKTLGLATQGDVTQLRDEIAQRTSQLDDRLSRVGAMGAALGGMAGAIAAADPTQHRVSAAVGSYRGKGAVAMGFTQRLPGGGAMLVGGSLAGDHDSAATVGMSFGW